MTDTERVRNAIRLLKEKDPSYYTKCIRQRLFNGGEGSYYDPNVDFNTLEAYLECSNWTMVENPNVDDGCSCFVCYDLKGHIGIVDVENVPNDVNFFLDDFKGTGKLSLCVKQYENWFVPMGYTYIILGNDGYGEIMFTFHPGEPLKPSTMEDGHNEYGLHKGDVITKEKAIKCGFKHAKVVR